MLYMIMHFVENEFRTYERELEIDDFKMTELKTFELGIFELAVSESD